MADGTMRAMMESELIAYLQSCEAASATFGSTELAAVQKEALNRFYGRDYGTEVDGRSKAKTHDVRELINWAMPALMRVFESSDDLVSPWPNIAPKMCCCTSRATSISPSHVAKQMADGLNHIYFSDNEGYNNTYDFLFDGLTQRVGIMQVRWLKDELSPPELFEELNLLQIEQLTQRGYKILEHRPCADDGYGQPDTADAGPQPAVDQMQPGQAKPECFDVRAQRTIPGRIEVRAVPPEEFSWEGTARSLAEARYQRRIERVFLRELQQCYHEKASELERASSGDAQIGDIQARWLARHPNANSGDDGLDNGQASAKRVLVSHEFVRIDYDGDGIIELREVLRVGTVILHNEVSDRSQYHIWSPVRIPHTVSGLSLADDAVEIQGIRTSLTRRGLDSLAATLNTKVAYDVQKVAPTTLDALLDNRFGAPVPVEGDPRGSLFPMTVQDVSAQAMEWSTYFKGSIESQTGIGPNSNGIDPNNLAANQSGVATNLQQMASSGRLEMIARAAAAGLQSVFQTILALVVQHQTDVRQIQRINQPPLVLDPAQWSPDASISLHVAIATASRNSQLAHLSAIAGKQEQILLQLGPSNPLVGIDQYANTLREMAEAMGFRNPDRFFKRVDPNAEQQMPPKQDPAVVAAQAATQLAKEKQDAEQVRLDEAQHLNQSRQERQVASELDLKRRQIADELALKRAGMVDQLALQREMAGLKQQSGLNGPLNGGGGPVSTISVGGRPG